MKLAIATLLVCGVAAFTPSTPTFVGRGIATASQTAIFADPEEEEGGLDLDLEEMFDMYVFNSPL